MKSQELKLNDTLFSSLPFPTTKNESYKYFPLAKLKETTWKYSLQKPEESFDTSSLTQGLKNYLVLYNGILIDESLSDHQLEILSKPKKEAPLKDYFLALNQQLGEKIFSLVLGGSQPLDILIINSATDQLIVPSFVIKNEQQASLNLQFLSTQNSSNTSLVVPYFEIHVENKTSLDLNILYHQNSNNFLLNYIKIYQAKDSQVNCHINYLHTFFSRTYLEVLLEGENAKHSLKGVIVGKQKDQNELFSLIKHLNTYTHSEQYIKTIALDSSHLSFNGDIFVDKLMVSCKAHQLFKGILLGDNAKVFARPQLHVHNDNIEGFHGATIGNLREEEIFFLNARGIPTILAKKIMIKGFLKEVIDEYPSYLRDIIYKHLNSLMEEFIGIEN
jgi:hypothetical protein